MSLRNNNEFFKKLSNSEKERILLEITEHRTRLTCRLDDSDDFFHVEITNFTGKELSAQFSNKEDMQDFQKGKLFINFKSGTSRYFFTGNAQRFDDHISIDTGDFVFLLQRRKNARVQLPQSYPGELNISEVNGGKVFVTARLHDISAGGCRFVIRSGQGFQLNENDEVKAFVRLGTRNPFEMTMALKHVELSHGVYTVGAQFSGINNSIENRLLGMMIDLQRELFVKYNS